MRHEVTTHHVPSSPLLHQMESDDVRAVLLVVLHHEARRLFVKEFHTPAVADQSIRHNNTKARRLPRVDSVSELGLLQNAQTRVRLGHSAHHQLEAAIAAVSDVVGPETDYLLFFV